MEKQITQFKKIAFSILSFLGFSSFAMGQCAAGEVEVHIDITTDSWGYECYWELVPSGNSCGTGTIASGGNPIVGCVPSGAGSAGDPGAYGSGSTFTEGPFCLTDGANYDIITTDDYGDGGTVFEVYFDGTLVHTFTGTGSGNTFTFTAMGPPSSNLTLEQVYYDTLGAGTDTTSIKYYSYIPVRQSSMDSIYFAGSFFNNGTSDQTNAVMSTTVTHNSNTVYSDATAPVSSIVSGGKTDAIIANPFTATATGVYNVSFDLTSDSTDQNPSDNMVSGSFEVTDTVYARDDGNYTGWGGWIGSGELFAMANWFEVFTDDTASSISIFLQGNTTDPAVVQVHLYDNTLTPIVSSGFITINASGSGIGSWVTIPIPETPMPRGGYAAGVETFSTDVLVAINPDAAPPQTSYVYVPNDGQWYWLSYIPFIRLNTKAPSVACDLSASSGASSDVSCPGYADGYAMATGGGGTGPYVYDWSNGATTDSIGGLSGGSYSVNITDANNCAYTLSFNVSEPAALSLSSASTDVTCNGGTDGVAALNVSGGTAPYGYNWSTGATTASLSGVAAGTYDVTVTDANSCPSANLSITVSEPAAMGLAWSETTATCGVGGSATVTVTGGSAPYMYSWDDPAMQSTATANGLNPGLYTVTVTDDNGCVATLADSVSGTDPVSFTSSATNPSSCGAADGSATVTIVTGTAPFNYSWSNGGASSSATGLAAGSYSVTVTDFLGCQASETVNIVDAGAPTLNMTDSTQVSCLGGSDGDATVTAFGGTPAYTYSWSNGQSTQQATGLAAGTYTVTVTGSDGCAALASITISEPATAVAIDSLDVMDVSCNGSADGSAMVYASGGTGSLGYSWSSGATTNSATGLAGGGYAIVVTDANGCTASDSVWVDEADALSATVSTTNITCNGADDGELDLTVTGGTAPFTYSWTPGGATTEDLTGLSAGTYSVQVEDANGCTGNTGSSITEPLALSVSTGTITDVSSAGGSDGSADMTVTGGTAPYTYLWNTGETTEDLTNVGAGTYTLAVTDANGCPGTAVAVISEPTGITENNANAGFSVYPNPNDGKFKVTISSLTEDKSKLVVRNIIGQLVYSEQLSKSTVAITKYIDLSDKERGVYFISLEKKDGMRTEKLIVY